MILHRPLVLILVFPISSLAGEQFYTNCFNKLTDVPIDIPTTATRIYLSNNYISNIEPGVFVYNTKCTNLRLNHNKLTEVRSGMWKGLGALEYLSLEHNGIGYIAPSAFADLPSLKGLYLHDNKLTTLPVNIFPPKQMLTMEILTLHHNNLKRNDLGWLRELCENGQIQEYTIRGDDILCTVVTEAPRPWRQQPQPKVSVSTQMKHKTQDKRNPERRDLANSTTQLEHNTQDEAASHVEVTTADTSTGDYQIVDETTITGVTDPQPKYALELPPTPENEAKTREYSHQDLVMWIFISAGGAILFTGTVIVLVLMFRALIASREKENRLKWIHQRQDNRPPAPLPPTWRNAQPPTTLQGLQEYRVLVDPEASTLTSQSSGPYASIQTNQSSDAYAVPYQHMLDRFIAFMTMYQRRRRPLPRPLPRPPDLISSAPSSGDTSSGYLEPSFNPRYQELNEASLLANSLTDV